MSQPYANLLGALKEGYFFKCGDKHKTWKQRWFVLTKDILYYFEKETSTEPLGIIPLKDYQRCKGMDGDALQATRKENSFYLQTPYRMYKAYCKDWKTSELWAESITALGEFLKKKEDIRKPTRYQNEVIRLASDVINFGSSLVHWFKLVVDSTPSYKNGVRSIYASAIYDIPSDLGSQVIQLTQAAVAAINSPNSPAKLESLKYVGDKVMTQIDRAEAFVVCCADTHKNKFTADLDVMRKATKEIIEMKPIFPLNDIADASIALCKIAYTLCQPYVEVEDIIVPPGGFTPNIRSGRPSSTAPPSSPSAAPPGPVTPSSLLQEYKTMSRVVSTNLDSLKGKPLFPTEQSHLQHISTCVGKIETATTELVTQLQQSNAGRVNQSKVAALYHDLPANCREILTLSEKLFTDSS